MSLRPAFAGKPLDRDADLLGARGQPGGPGRGDWKLVAKHRRAVGAVRHRRPTAWRPRPRGDEPEKVKELAAKWERGRSGSGSDRGRSPGNRAGRFGERLVGPVARLQRAFPPCNHRAAPTAVHSTHIAAWVTTSAHRRRPQIAACGVAGSYSTGSRSPTAHRPSGNVAPSGHRTAAGRPCGTAPAAPPESRRCRCRTPAAGGRPWPTPAPPAGARPTGEPGPPPSPATPIPPAIRNASPNPSTAFIIPSGSRRPPGASGSSGSSGRASRSGWPGSRRTG